MGDWHLKKQIDAGLYPSKSTESTEYEQALKANETNPIKYNGMWFPIGTLKLLEQPK